MRYTHFIVAIACLTSIALGGREKILLKDIDVLTLYTGQYTTARRSHAVLQLQCVGGTAGCKSFIPQVVQCYNRGSDGYDIQWECKTDMDNAYRFGKIAVTCEGYEYPEDPYILRGSCGLEYNLDLTKEGYEHQSPHHNLHTKSNDNNVGAFVSIVILIMAAIVIGSIVKMYMSNSHQADDAPPPYPGYTGSPTAPPPPGFHPEYTAPPPPPSGFYPGYSASAPPPPGFNPGYATSAPPPSGFFPGYSAPYSTRAGNGGGFWSGAATGGVLGYLFGSRGQGNQCQQPPYQAPRSSSWWSSNSNNDSGWGSSSTASTGNTGSSGSVNTGSTGTRTASGFGGTRRR